MNQQVAQLPARQSLTEKLASKFDIDRNQFVKTVKATCIKDGCTDEQFAQFLMVCNEYDLNPFTKEIYAFPTRGGGIQPIVSIDGWLKMINSHPQFDGMEMIDHKDDQGKLTAVTVKMFRKDRNHPTSCTEYMEECQRNTDTWRKWPARMLRHKATIQAARYAFGFSGIADPDEGERIKEVEGSRMINDSQISTIEQLSGRLNVSGIEKYYQVDSLAGLTFLQAEQEIKRLNDTLALTDAIHAIKQGIEVEDLFLAAETYFELTDAERETLYRAHTKGGVFTTQENKVIKEQLRAVYYGDIENG